METYSSILAWRIPWTEKLGEAVNLKLLDILIFLKKENRNVSLFIKSLKSELFKNNVETSQNMSVSQMWPVNCQYMEIFYVSR